MREDGLNQEDLNEARENTPENIKKYLKPKELLYLFYLNKFTGDRLKAFSEVSPNVAEHNIKKNYKYLDNKVAKKVPKYYNDIISEWRHMTITGEEQRLISLLDQTNGNKKEAVRILNPNLSESYLPMKTKTMFDRIERKDPHYLSKLNEKYNVLDYYDKIHVISQDTSQQTIESQRKASRDMIELLGHAQSKVEVNVSIDHLDVTIDKLLNITNE